MCLLKDFMWFSSQLLIRVGGLIKDALNNTSIHRILFSNELISLRIQCGLKCLGWASHIKFSCMFSSCAVFIRFMMVTRGEDIRMSSEHLRPNQASLKKIILILSVLLFTCSIWIIGISIVNMDFYRSYSIFEQICQDVLIKNDKRATFSLYGSKIHL